MISAATREGEWHPPLRARHPCAEALRRFARGEATREEGRQVVAHLLGRCPACGLVVSGAAGLAGPKDRSGLVW